MAIQRGHLRTQSLEIRIILGRPTTQRFHGMTRDDLLALGIEEGLKSFLCLCDLLGKQARR